MPSDQLSGVHTWTDAGLWGSTGTLGSAQGRVADRYSLLRVLGRGGGGEVWAAWDEVEQRQVALKRLLRTDDPRLHREIGALRMLDQPGVVRLHDVIDIGDATWLCMEQVQGDPFPGRPLSGGAAERWVSVRPTVLALLEAIAAVHDLGIVHRDLKPGNVLVDADGAPVILDFGLARGELLDPTLTATGKLVGTPAYVAPELIGGRRADVRSDLYSLGVMIYEAVTGQLPHGATTVAALLGARLASPARPVRSVAPDLPEAVGEVIDALLERAPDRRPQSARAVLSMLGGDGEQRLPWLGDREAQQAAADRLLQGAGFVVAGPPGSGRSRFLAEVEALLADAGASALHARPGGRPFESLRHLVADDGGDLRAGLGGVLGAGILVADDFERLDRWSRGLLSHGSHAVLVATTRTVGADHVLGPLSEPLLRGLFAGPDRVLHIPEDAGAQLFLRTGGLARRVDQELRGWVRSGLARWQGDRLVLDRGAVERLRAGAWNPVPSARARRVPLEPALAETLAWLHLAGGEVPVEVLSAAVGRPAWELALEVEALVDAGAVLDEGLRVVAEPEQPVFWTLDQERAGHLALADALPPGSRRRVRHLLAAADETRLADEALRLARDVWWEGRVEAARGLLAEVLRRQPTHRGCLALLTRLAIADGSEVALRQAAGRLARALPAHAAERRLVDGVMAVRRRDAATARSLLDALSPFDDDLHLEIARQGARLGLARLGPLSDEARLLADLEAWAAALSDPLVDAKLAGWQGLHAYRRLDFGSAGRLHEQSAAGPKAEGARLSSLINAASAWMEAGDHDRAASLAAAARDRAAAGRLCAYEARAETYRRLAQLRGSDAPPDPGWLDDLDAWGDAELLAVAAAAEVGAAWRAGQHELGRALAPRAEAAALAAGSPHRWYAAALGVACGSGDDDRVLPALIEHAMAVMLVDAGGAVLSSGRGGATLAAAVIAAAERLPRALWQNRRGVLSIPEAVAAARRVPQR